MNQKDRDNPTSSLLRQENSPSYYPTTGVTRSSASALTGGARAPWEVWTGLLLLLVSIFSCREPSKPDSIFVLTEKTYQPFYISSFPVEVLIDDTLSLEYQVAVMDAVQSWNSLAGGEVFVTHLWNFSPSDLVGCRKVGVISKPLSYPTLGRTLIEADDTTGEICYSVVELSESVDIYKLTQITIHELGHCLGLTHNTEPGSIMYPKLPADSSAYFSEPILAFAKGLLP